MRLFALGPVGVTLFALAWFVMLLDPTSREPGRAMASWAALLAVVGFVADAVLDLGPNRTRRALLCLLGLEALGLAGLAVLTLPTRVLLGAALPQVLAMGGVVFIGGARLVLCRHENAAMRRLSRHVVALVLATLAVCVIREGIELARGAPVGSVSLLGVILAVETIALSYILHERVDVRLPVTRAVTHALLAIAVAFIVVAVLRVLGYPVDLGQATVTVGVAILASLIFVGLGDQLSRIASPFSVPVKSQTTRSPSLLARSTSLHVAFCSRSFSIIASTSASSIEISGFSTFILSRSLSATSGMTSSVAT
jgi:hypothetical protein